MAFNDKWKIFFTGTCIFFCIQASFCQVRLPRLIRDSMVLQRDTKINIWGWAAPKEKVTIRFLQKKYTTTAGASGKWKVSISPIKAGGPYTMKLSASNTITLTDILIGDVWICSGQSNMVHQMNIHDITYANEISTANYPKIRQFLVPVAAEPGGPAEDLSTGFWQAAVGNDVRPFSAVAYFFAKELYEKYQVPIGLINASVGGTPIEAWTSEEGLKEFPGIQGTIQKNKDTGYVNRLNRIALANSKQATPIKDKGLTEAVQWFYPGYVPAGWHTINIPGYWEDQGVKELNGVVWYRREIEIPAAMTGQAAKIFLGRIVDADILYINGKVVGSTTYQYPQRRYTIPSGLLKTGKNILVIRVTNNYGKGGFVPDKPYMLFTTKDTVDLKGYWQYKVGEVFKPYIPVTQGIHLQDQPTALYNGMIAPVTDYSIKGFLWYQGEANTSEAKEYTKLQPAQIADWRSKWKQGDLPFLFVQLPNFMDVNYLPSESQWAALREAQLSALSVPNTGMAVAIDLGEWNDIHPDNKKEVGVRLALLAQKIAYKENIVSSGPLFKSATINENTITVSFTNTGSGLVTNNGEPPGAFAIAGKDKNFAWANARIEKDKVILSAEAVPFPAYVRYAWSDNPTVNLYNIEGLPASPFRTDQ